MFYYNPDTGASVWDNPAAKSASIHPEGAAPMSAFHPMGEPPRPAPFPASMVKAEGVKSLTDGMKNPVMVRG